MNSVAQMLQQGLQYHQAGNLQQAEQLYHQILKMDPRHADALHLIGLIAHQAGRNDVAVDYMRQALRVHPKFPAAHNNLGLALKNQGKLADAVASYHEALRLKPDYAEACNNLANALQEQGKFEKAISNYRKALRLKPDYPEAHNNLGNALKDLGKLDEAVASYHEALRLRPNYAQAHFNLGNALKDQRKLEEAIAHYEETLRLKPEYAEAHCNLGLALQDQGKLEEATARYREALRLKPAFPEACCNLGNALKDQWQLDEAITQYREALHLNPGLAEARNNLGIALQDQGKSGEAITCYREALRLRPDYAEAYNNLGLALQDQGKLEEAIAQYQQALRLRPGYADAYNNVGNTLQDQGKLEEAVAGYRQALRLKPDFAWAYNNLGNALKDQGELDEAISLYRQALELKPDFAAAHDSLVMVPHYHPGYDAAALYQEARRWNDQHAEPLAKYRRPHENTADPERRLRVGYVSPDFRNHAVSFLLMPLLANHDHGQVEVFCYAEVPRPDDVTDRLRGCADGWRSTVGLTNEQMTELVRNDRIDILVDLAVHTAKNRLLVFARKPAPVQATWMVPGTTGLSTIDYRLTDPYFDPPGEDDSCYSEQSVRLPDTFWCYDPLCEQLPVNELPALANGFITFGCLNNFCKVNDGVLGLWAKVLGAVPRSRLLLMAPRGRAREHVLAKLTQQGIDKSRIEFADRQPRQQYLQLHNRIDVGLDLLPYSGHTTSFDAFWMGVPTVTLIGKTAVGRAGWSQLNNLGLRELGARTPEEYVEIMVRLSQDLPRLSDLRAGLRARMQASPLMDGKRFAHHVEQAYRQMWRAWCDKRESGVKAETDGPLPIPDVVQENSDLNTVVQRLEQPLQEAATDMESDQPLPPVFQESSNLDSVAQMLGQAFQHHRAGDFDQAERLYQQILTMDPQHVNALHLIGLIAHQVGRNDQAVDYIEQALRVHPHFPEAHNNLGLALKGQGRLEEAVAHHQQALELKPDYAEAHNNLGNALKDQGKLAEAIAHYRQALSLKPDYAEAYSNLGLALQHEGKLDDAVAACRQALRLNPHNVRAHNNLGLALQEQGKIEDAIASYQEALRLQPEYAQALNNLGNALQDQGKIEDAVSNFQQALRLKPDFPEAHNNLGNALQEQGKIEDAIASYQRALHLKPGYAEAHYNLGSALAAQGNLEEAVASYEQALRLKPEYAEAHNNLAHALTGLGRLDEAISNYREAQRLEPDDAELHSNLVFSLHFHPDYDASAILQEARRWNGQHAEALAKFNQPHANRPDPNRRLRIGYVSPDFRDHCQSFFTVPLLSNHDRQVEIFCYADDARPDAVTERLRGYPNVWRSTVDKSNHQVAELIRSDQIDILVDLTMHMAKNRLLVFARKPAPVQVTWLAYPGTTGLSAMDYRLTDPYLDPPGETDSCYAEQSIRLPDTFWCYDPLCDEPLVNDLPALANGFITFGCLNHFCKVNDGVLGLWAKVLGAVPQSRLLLLAPKGPARDHVLAILKQQGIAEPRVEFVDRQARQQYLELYHRIDLGLDLVPYNGHTTSLDAFWMGVPTVTLIGDTVVGRAGWSQLCNLDLRELAARTPEEYVEIMVQLAGDPPKLRDLRAALRGWMEESPLMDGHRFAHNVEQAYRQMWRAWCQREGGS